MKLETFTNLPNGGRPYKEKKGICFRAPSKSRGEHLFFWVPDRGGNGYKVWKWAVLPNGRSSLWVQVPKPLPPGRVAKLRQFWQSPPAIELDAPRPLWAKRPMVALSVHGQAGV